MAMANLAAQIFADPAALEALVAPLGDAAAAELVEHLKSEADRHWFINANRSLELAELIVRAGRQRGDPRQVALGTMARGDALKLLGQLQEAWGELERAGRMFMEAGDEVGWARTRIGRLLVCVELNRVAEALRDARAAREIFARYGEAERALRVDLNQGIVHNVLGQQELALQCYAACLETAQAMGDGGDQYLGSIFTNIGNVYDALGELGTSLQHHQLAKDMRIKRGEEAEVALTNINIAHILMAQGHYKRSLELLYEAYQYYCAARLNYDANDVRKDIVEQYLSLNRFEEARELAHEAACTYSRLGAAYAEGQTLLHLATAEAELGRFDAADATLSAARAIFATLQATSWMAALHLQLGRIALKQGDLPKAEREAQAAMALFAKEGQHIDQGRVALLYGQTQLAAGNLDAARTAGVAALGAAKYGNIPALRYSAHLLLGRVAEARARSANAGRSYAAAVATVERVQRGLTITLRPGFLENKGEALRALIGLHGRSGNAAKAFEALERAKSQALLSYLTHHESLRWRADDPRAQPLIQELNRLREEHHWLYRRAHEHADDEGRAAVTPAQARAQLGAHEKRMRAITEQLHLHGNDLEQVTPPTLRDVQDSLADDTLLIEFFNDGATLWAFLVSRDAIRAQRLPAAASDVDRLVEQLRRSVGFALDAGPNAPAARGLASVARLILQRLYAALLAPIEAEFRGRRMLNVVPYGALHYLPFHLLHDGAAYVIERHEVGVLPAAGLLTRPGPARPAGARVLAHSWGGRLPLTQREAQTVQRFFGSRVYMEAQARRDALGGAPEQILHIAAHGQHRLDQPDLSFIQLADGQLYTDDLLQHDLSYELVVLSACETGRANVAAGDELIGLGRGFLYAGAGALIASLWRVADALAVELMAHLYQGLSAGASKSAALRAAQLALLTDHPQLHPAFWGAFQLVGDARPLTGPGDGAPTSAEISHYQAAFA